jgi:hypothetical protein
MIKKILFALAAIVVLFVVIVVVQPGEFRIARSAIVNAPAAAVFAQVNDFRKWDAWSPWAKRDPKMKVTHEGAPAGAGATYYWSGNNEVGEGRMTLTESRAGELVRIKLDFIRPFASTNITEFAFKPDGERTNVTWSMSGTNNFMAKAFGLFVDVEKMVGADFEKGLGQLKSVAEAGAK